MSIPATPSTDAPAGQPAPALAPGRALKRILFVDDEPEFLESLTDVMHRYRHVWRVEVAPGGPEALEALAQEPADVVVCDMRMPAIDGASLLAEVRDLYPSTIRMVLSGVGRPEDLTRAAVVSHRFLTKPCDPAELGRLISRSCAVRERTGQASAYRATTGASTLPSRPGLYTEINQVIADPRWEPRQVAAVIERDVAMSAKVLQMANSAYFGGGRRVSFLGDAVMYLGVDAIKSLTLTAEAFGKLAHRSAPGFSIDRFQRHAMLVARVTAGMLPAGRGQQEAVTAALLHDIGELVLIADDPQRWTRLNEEAVRRELPLHEIELEREGVTHADTGAYLLSLWGLPDAIVEAVVHHHDPGTVPGLAFDSVAAVHIADALAHEVAPDDSESAPAGALDGDLIARLGLAPRLDLWRHLARQIADSEL